MMTAPAVLGLRSGYIPLFAKAIDKRPVPPALVAVWRIATVVYVGLLRIKPFDGWRGKFRQAAYVAGHIRRGSREVTN